MFWTIAPIVITMIIVIIYIVVSVIKKNTEYIVLVSFLIALIGGIAIRMIFQIVGMEKSPYIIPYAVADKDNPTYLHSLGNSKELSGSGNFNGSFFLGTGSISSDIEQINTYHYFYYLNGKDGGIASETIDQKRAIIFEDTETEPYFLKYKIECPEDREQGVFIIDTCKESLETATYQYELEFHIPAGSIDYNYSIKP